jgi:LDH2 family malate/lactate/ureidoglycolate dehydrogenase
LFKAHVDETDLDTFKSDMDEYLSALRNARPGHESVMYPGLNAHEVERDRRKHGTPYHPEVLEWLATLCGEQGIESSLPTP